MQFQDNLIDNCEKRLNNSSSPYPVDCHNLVYLEGCLFSLKNCTALVAPIFALGKIQSKLSALGQTLFEITRGAPGKPQRDHANPYEILKGTPYKM